MTRLYKSILGIAIVFTIALIFFFIANHTTRTVVVQRILDAAPDRVWALWTDSDAMRKWWSPKDFTAPTIKNDVRIGGHFLFAMKAPNGQVSWNTGEYTDIVLNHKLVAVMSFADENGQPVSAKHYHLPGAWPDQIGWTTEFAELGEGKTQVTVTETGIPAVMYVFAKLGWEQQLDKFAQLLK